MVRTVVKTKKSDKEAGQNYQEVFDKQWEDGKGYKHYQKSQDCTGPIAPNNVSHTATSLAKLGLFLNQDLPQTSNITSPNGQNQIAFLSDGLNFLLNIFEIMNQRNLRIFLFY